MDLGFEQAGIDVSFVNENFEPFLKAYKYSREKLSIPEPEFGYSQLSVESFYNEAVASKKLTKHVVDARKSNSLVGFIGGPPCPDFSNGGKHKGFSGENGRLTRVYFDLILKQKPDWFLFENVKGLFRTKLHRQFFNDLLSDVRKAGYAVNYNVLNALEFGVPQYRERIIIFGIKKSLARKDLLSSHLDVNTINDQYTDLKRFDPRKFSKYSHDEIFDLEWPVETKFTKNCKIRKPRTLPSDLTVEGWFRSNQVQRHPNSSHHFLPSPGNKRFKTVKEGDTSGKSYKRLHRWRYSPTAAYGNNEVHLHPYLPRRLSASEALALQSMPQKFSLPLDMPLSAMFKTIGNGVPFLMAKGIAKSIKSYLSYLDNLEKELADTSVKFKRR